MTIEEMACRVTVRWWDGYIETFDATEVRAGAYMLYIKQPSLRQHIAINGSGTHLARWESIGLCCRKRIYFRRC